MKHISWFVVTLLSASIAIANAETYSQNMNLPVPTVGVTRGPIYATDINTSLGIIDAHDHSAGHGVPVTPSGLNINSDLTCQANNITNLRTTRFTPQVSVISGSGADVGALYEVGVDLYYNDGSGNQIRITQSGSVTGATGTITGLPSGTAGAAYSAGAFIFSQATSTPANIDAGTYILRYPGSYPTPAGNYIALEAPTSLATGFALILPNALPGTTGFWQTSDTSGNQSWTGVDNATLQYSANVVSIKNSGVGTTQIADGAVTQAKRAALGQQVSSAVSPSTISGSVADATGLTITITTTGRPVFVGLTSGQYNLVSTGNSTSPAALVGTINIVRVLSGTPTTIVSTSPTIYADATAGGQVRNSIPAGSIMTIDPIAAGTYTYKIQFAVSQLSGGGSPALSFTSATLFAYEL